MTTRPVVEHVVTVETRDHTQSRGAAGEVETFRQERRVCSCGFVTSWHRESYLAQRRMDHHTLDGQQSFAL